MVGGAGGAMFGAFEIMRCVLDAARRSSHAWADFSRSAGSVERSTISVLAMSVSTFAAQKWCHAKT